ncbi:MAG TPA: hypothetical protein DD727_00810, partial [Clostridiales bacterium]|nr:hypothetical protein [Clostridiales bacterium]
SFEVSLGVSKTRFVPSMIYSVSQETIVDITLYPKNIEQDKTPVLNFFFGLGTGSFEISDVELLQGENFATYRKFENGVVLMNGTRQAVEFDLSKIAPGARLFRIPGRITPEVNNGQKAGKKVVLGPYDGLVLIDRRIMQDFTRK